MSTRIRSTRNKLSLVADIEIRRAADADAEAIAAVLAAAFAAHRSEYTPAAYDATVLDVDRVAARLDEGPAWVAVAADAVVGTIAARPHADGIYVRSLAVLPSMRGTGVAKRLIDAVIAWAAGEGAHRLTLSTTPFLTASRRLYQRCGFVDDEGYDGGDLHGTPLIALVLHLQNTGTP